MNKIAIFLLLLFCCLGFSNAQTSVEAEEYNVYKTLLNGEKSSLVSKFTISENIDYVFKSQHNKRKLSLVQSETRKNYNIRNQIAYELKNNFEESNSVNLVTGRDLQIVIDALGKNADELTIENNLREKYGSGSLTSFSRVGFNKAKSQALVIVVSNTGLCGTCSTNYLIILSKKNGSWKIDKQIMTSIS